MSRIPQISDFIIYETVHVVPDSEPMLKIETEVVVIPQSKIAARTAWKSLLKASGFEVIITGTPNGNFNVSGQKFLTRDQCSPAQIQILGSYEPTLAQREAAAREFTREDVRPSPTLTYDPKPKPRPSPRRCFAEEAKPTGKVTFNFAQQR